MTELEKLQKEVQKLKKENADLKKKKKFGLVWEEREREQDIDDGEYYPYLVQKGKDFGFDNGDNNKNILIEGDNYHALEILQYTHKDKIDVIYIDPPYNTGKKKEFRYGDKWIDKDDGYKHSYWLSFMEKRLKLAKSLMSQRGVIIISIDDNEFAHLKLLCDDIFRPKNFIGCLPTIMNLKGNNDNFGFSGTHEYTLVYTRDKEFCELNHFNLDDDELNTWKEDEYGYYKVADNLRATGVNAPRNMRKNLWYPIFLNEKTEEFYTTKDNKPMENSDIAIYPVNSAGDELSWYWKKSNINDNNHNLVLKKTNNGWQFYKKQRPQLGDLPTKKPKSIFYKPDYSTSTATNKLKAMFGKKVFASPKPVALLKDFIFLASKKNSIILDFFAGSGTSAQAILELNQEDNCNRKFILCTNNENNICEEVTYLRIEKIINGYNIIKPKTKKKPEQIIKIDGLDSNLEYLKIETLKYDDKRHSELDVKDFMVDKLIEILKIKEMCFSLEQVSDFLYRFNKEDKDVYILSNIYNMKKKDYENTRNLLEKSSNNSINIYILALQNHAHYEKKLLNINKKIIFEPLPENFLKLLRKIQRKKR